MFNEAQEEIEDNQKKKKKLMLLLSLLLQFLLILLALATVQFTILPKATKSDDFLLKKK